MPNPNSFNARGRLSAGGREYVIYRLDALEKQSKSERQLDEKLRAAQLLGGQ